MAIKDKGLIPTVEGLEAKQKRLDNENRDYRDESERPSTVVTSKVATAYVTATALTLITPESVVDPASPTSIAVNVPPRSELRVSFTGTLSVVAIAGTPAGQDYVVVQLVRLATATDPLKVLRSVATVIQLNPPVATFYCPIHISIIDSPPTGSVARYSVRLFNETTNTKVQMLGEEPFQYEFIVTPRVVRSGGKR